MNASITPGKENRSPGTWLGWLVLLVVTVGLRWIAVEQYEQNHPFANAPVIDEQSYVEWGARIAGGEWLGTEVFFQEPLYPYFIGVCFSVFGEDLHALRLLQCLLGALSACLLWGVTEQLFGRKAAWLSAGAFAVFPPAILMPCLLLKPNLFLPIMASMLWLLSVPGGRRRHWALLGILGGLGALLRGNLLILLPFFLLWPLLQAMVRRQAIGVAVQRSALFLFGVSCVLLPVFGRNWVVGQQFALTTSGAGTNVYGGNNRDNPYGVATEFPWVRGIPRYEAGDWRREAERRLGAELDGSGSSSYWLNEALTSMGRDPVLHLSIFWNKLRLALNDYEVPDNHHLGWDAQYVGVLRLPWPGFGVWGGLAMGGLLLALWRRDLGGARWEVALVFVLYLGTIVATVMSMRARLPLVLMLFPFAGYGLLQASRAWSRGENSRGRGSVLACMLFGLLIPWVPVFDGQQLEQDYAERDYNLAVTWLAQDAEFEAACKIAGDLAGRFPHSSRLQILLADTEWRRGRAERTGGAEQNGQALIQAALARLQPITRDGQVSARERSRAYRLAAYIQADLGRWEVAERFFRAAREFAPEDIELLVSHAQALLQLPKGSDSVLQERRVEAHTLLREVLSRSPQSPEAVAAKDLLSQD